MACEQYAAYHLGDIDAETWQHHLETCAACRQAVAQDAAIEAQMQAVDVPPADEALWQRIAVSLETESKRPKMTLLHHPAVVWAGRIAAVLVAGIALGYGIGLRSSSHGTLDSRGVARLAHRENTLVQRLEGLTARADVHSAQLDLDDRLRYRDYLETLDRQVGEVREALATNPGNRHLRKALLEALTEKQQVLEEMLHYQSPSPVPVIEERQVRI